MREVVIESGMFACRDEKGHEWEVHEQINEWALDAYGNKQPNTKALIGYMQKCKHCGLMHAARIDGK